MQEEVSPSVLLVEPFYGGSHKQLMDLLRENVHGCVAFTLPAKKWHWRARTAALHFMQSIPASASYRVLFASSVLNLCELVSLRPDLSPLKKVLYFHENQLAYPVRKDQQRDFQYGYNQVLSCLVADVVVFNSLYNMESFLSSISSFMKRMPDHRPKDLDQLIRPKCQVLHFPLQLPDVTRFLPKHKLLPRPVGPSHSDDITEPQQQQQQHGPLSPGPQHQDLDLQGPHESRAEQRDLDLQGPHESRAGQGDLDLQGPHESRAEQRDLDLQGPHESRAGQGDLDLQGPHESRAEQRELDLQGPHESRAEQRELDLQGPHESRAEQRDLDLQGPHESRGAEEKEEGHMKPLHIVWPHRWEHDKDPELLFSTLLKLKERSLDFHVSVLGETFTDVPEIFPEARRRLDRHILHWGFLPSKDDFLSVLCQADVVVSTARHEFFGVAMLEAVHCGCFPLCPKALVYPEIFPAEYLYATPEQLCKRLQTLCRRPDVARRHKVKVDVSAYSWSSLGRSYQRLLAT
ncbi:tRNA-queuosine alpha-mannosyltransferase [Genypterus blacodes]|uniref:tRNA-queuosine alpha-mannosyltransferase n=1 Tax=Genypterus blacodes TaxID=154954 RepID=UPI003F75AE46